MVFIARFQHFYIQSGPKKIGINLEKKCLRNSKIFFNGVKVTNCNRGHNIIILAAKVLILKRL